MNDVFDSLPAACRAKLRPRAQPRWIEPMLATLTDEPFSHPDWIFERKLDGVRCLAFRHHDTVRLVSRNRQTMTDTWPELAADLAREACQDFVVDGEIVAFEQGRTSFSRLQQRSGLRDRDRARASDVTAYLYLFDLLHAEGSDTSRLPQRRRKALLKRLLSFPGRVRFTPHRNERGEAWLEEACDKGWEGLIAKDARASYVHGRSRRWLKLKCSAGQELVIGGYTDPQGSRTGFGALLVGYYEKGALRYAGKVGTGYDEETLRSLRRRLETLGRADSPFADEVPARGAHFVRPRLVAEVAFTEWTEAGRLRHPRFLGLRGDKDPEDVRRERPQ